MAEYKDITPLKTQIADVKRAVVSGNSAYLTGYISALSATEGIIAGLPEADVTEVKHGTWNKTDRGIRTNLNTGKHMRVYACDCSCCGWHTGNQGIDFKYCPQCGAKMDGKV